MQTVVLFDGVCNLCSASVQFLLRHDRNGVFQFASQQSPVGHALLARHGVHANLGSIVLIQGEQVFTESDAALRIARQLPWPWRLAWGLRVVPRFLRDGAYRVVARSRYRVFGKREACWLPSPEWRERFLDGAPTSPG